MREITSDELLDNQLVDYTRDIVEFDGVLDIYLHKSGGEVLVGGGSLGAQKISSLPISSTDQNFYENFFAEVDTLIDLDFHLVDNESISDISVYYDTEIETGDGEGTVLGLTVKNPEPKGNTFEVFLNIPAFNGNTPYIYYAFIHELSHTFGLEHPFNDSDGDVFEGITSPWKSAYPEETVMSYRAPYTGIWPSGLTQNDVNALLSAWGAEENPRNIYDFDASSDVKDVAINWLDYTSSSIPYSSEVNDSILHVEASSWVNKVEINYAAKSSSSGGLLQAKQNPAAYDRTIDGRVGSLLDGSSGEDVLRGLGGWDLIDGGGGDDLIHGGNGRDIIKGNKGSDELHGDFGWNTFESEKDGDLHLIAIKSDQHLENWWYGKAGNSPNGEKTDIITGLDSFDELIILGASTSELTFSANASANGASGVGIYAKGSLEAIYIGDDLSVAQLQSMTKGDASSLAMNNERWSYWDVNRTPPLLNL